ncbi:hypothetical protein EDB87DRAFT_1579126 [Lactarius vividus]|nr:hypothetical protein EDB87DRAFT_1579126 [Lactarius vividus]
MNHDRNSGVDIRPKRRGASKRREAVVNKCEEVVAPALSIMEHGTIKVVLKKCGLRPMAVVVILRWCSTRVWTDHKKIAVLRQTTTAKFVGAESPLHYLSMTKESTGSGRDLWRRLQVIGDCEPIEHEPCGYLPVNCQKTTGGSTSGALMKARIAGDSSVDATSSPWCKLAMVRRLCDIYNTLDLMFWESWYGVSAIWELLEYRSTSSDWDVFREAHVHWYPIGGYQSSLEYPLAEGGSSSYPQFDGRSKGRDRLDGNHWVMWSHWNVQVPRREEPIIVIGIGGNVLDTITGYGNCCEKKRSEPRARIGNIAGDNGRERNRGLAHLSLIGQGSEFSPPRGVTTDRIVLPRMARTVIPPLATANFPTGRGVLVVIGERDVVLAHASDK